MTRGCSELYQIWCSWRTRCVGREWPHLSSIYGGVEEMACINALICCGQWRGTKFYIFIQKVNCRLLEQLTCTKYNYCIKKNVKTHRKSKFIISGTPYIGIVATIYILSNIFASCEVKDNVDGPPRGIISSGGQRETSMDKDGVMMPLLSPRGDKDVIDIIGPPSPSPGPSVVLYSPSSWASWLIR